MAGQREKKVKVVLDTNIILASVSRKSPYRLIFDRFQSDGFELCVSTEILLEYEEKLKDEFSETLASFIMGAMLLKTNVIKTNIYFNWQLIPNDPDDNKFVDCALASNADYLVTNDKDFAVLKKIKFPPVRVIDIDTFLTVLKKT